MTSTALFPPRPMAATKRIEFWVPGIPKPGGSKKAFKHKYTGKIIVKEDCSKNADWRADVRAAAREVFQGEPLAVALRVSFGFVFTRPAGDFSKSKKNAGALLPSARPHPTVPPDVTKLIRSTEDALNAVVWLDDKFIVEQSAVKTFGTAPGCRIVVEVIEPAVPATDAGRGGGM